MDQTMPDRKTDKDRHIRKHRHTDISIRNTENQTI